MYCIHCGAELPEGTRFCTSCGSPVEDDVSSSDVFPTDVPPTAAPSSAPARARHVVPIVICSLVALVAVGALVWFVALGNPLPFSAQPSDEAAATSSASASATSSESAAATSAASPASTAATSPLAASASSSSATLSAHTLPTFSTAEASSVHADVTLDGHTYSYEASNACDNNTATAWNSDAEQEGSWLEFDDSYPQLVTTISILAGYNSNKTIYDYNYRPKDITISFSDGRSVSQTLSDSFGTWQTITLSSAVATTSVRITVNSCYPGSKYQDMAISEVKFS